MKRIQNYIGGEFVDPVSGSFLDDVDPATGATYALIPDSDSADVDRAVEAAERAFPKWSSTSADDRCRVMMKIADLLEARVDEFAKAECVDNGKPLTLARSM